MLHTWQSNATKPSFWPSKDLETNTILSTPLLFPVAAAVMLLYDDLSISACSVCLISERSKLTSPNLKLQDVSPRPEGKQASHNA